MPIYGDGSPPASIREGGTGVAALQVWHNIDGVAYLLFDGTLAGLAVGARGEIVVAGGAGVARGGAVVDGATGTVVLTPIPGAVSGGAIVSGATGAVVVAGVAGLTAHGQVVAGQTGAITVAGGVGQASTAEPGEAIGDTSAIVVAAGADGSAGGGGTAVGAVGGVSVVGIAGAASGGGGAFGSTGTVTVSGVAGVVAAGSTAIGSTGAVVVGGVAGIASAGQTVVGSTGAVTVAGVAGSATSTASPMGMDKSGTQALTSNTTQKVTGWTPRSGFPATVIDSNDLLINGPGLIDISATVTLTGPSPSSSMVLHIRKNGVTIASGAWTFNVAARTVSLNDHSVVAGDRLSVWIEMPFGTNATVQTGNTTNLLYTL